ncbi:3-carboxy-cis,cis-muconate cycloisomerase [Tropicimonas sp. IMCC34011]|uniref:3-carboxy-cis,cis-muconate cycloisomerase n=1 Tax=Tropicimonas sp. IMCC34011 TaxID=2248759 RepID=UPI000E24F64E|nr:3-carboxy-cis,cis-muconate cycloisomerase [Tropicimonas sp. IMCC34011]
MSEIFGHPWLGSFFGDAASAEIWSGERQMSHMLAFEAAWSRALGACGRVSPDVAERAAAAVESWTPDVAAIREGVALDGVPVPALTRALREAAGSAEDGVHRGATSQDVMDSALALTLKDMSVLLDQRLCELDAALSGLADRFGEAEIMGRTRMQAAIPIRAGHRIAAWAQPFARHRARLADLRPRVEIVQVGGVVGDRQELEPDAETMARHVADALGLAGGPCWHTERDGIAEYGGLLSMIAGSCGKIGTDICLMAQQGISDIALPGGGASSGMPHKRNPVDAELLITLAGYAATQLPALHHALRHEQERSGSAWALEWMVLPGLAQASARALAVATRLAEGATPA